MEYHLSPSILAADFTRLGEQVKEIRDAGSDWVHIDVMDGLFVPSISFGMPVVQSLRPVTDLFFDVHLMIREPIRYVKQFSKAGADLITIHAEACENIGETIKEIKKTGCKAGMSLNPETEVSVLKPWIKELDLVLVMSVHPGFGGQSFIEDSLDKIKQIRAMIEEQNPNCFLEVDGGISLANVDKVLEAGANVVVAGTAVFRGDIKQNVSGFLKAMQESV